MQKQSLNLEVILRIMFYGRSFQFVPSTSIILRPFQHCIRLQLGIEGMQFARIGSGAFHRLSTNKIVILHAETKNATKNCQPHKLGIRFGQELFPGRITASS